ncbi:hairy-related 3 [Gouania willdenowi]|uniref:hairy-related 3 n=1 Tax=Gouania willdenowi TaxID=441366 RepID=UPI00105665A2|nr:transcription factor HES-3-like [Gouania willdenowi]
MVAATDCAEKLKAGKKVSKPLMEKKRRARINQCLEQLKSLLESYYSSNIRKRKLEKADILELTVKHLKNLQRMQNYANAASEVSDYHKGFSSCLDNFSHYLLMSDSLDMGDHWMLSQLSNKLRRSQRKPGQPGSTSDSGPGRTDAQNGAQEAVTAAAGPEEGKMSPKSAAHRLQGGQPCTEDAWLQSADGEHANTHCNVWRPW